MKGKIYLIPNLLGECQTQLVIPEEVINRIKQINHFVVENIRSARRFLIKAGHPLKPEEIRFYELNKYDPGSGIDEFIQLCRSGNDLGVLSEAGIPGIADPGSELISAGHRGKIDIVPLSGPSSIFLALSASGLNGQQFVFHGYLPVKSHERVRKIKEIEMLSSRNKQTQIFIETPYRNMALFADLLKACHPDTLLCIGKEITTENESIRTMSIKAWGLEKPDLHKKPVVFLLVRK